MSSTAPVPSVPEMPPIQLAWAEAVHRERTWATVQTAALAFLLLAVLTWTRSASNVATEVALLGLVAYAGRRYTSAAVARAALPPLPADYPSTPPPAKPAPLARAPRA